MVVGLRFIYYRHTIPTAEEVASEKLLILTQVIGVLTARVVCNCWEISPEITACGR